MKNIVLILLLTTTSILYGVDDTPIDWNALDFSNSPIQSTEFERLLNELYAPYGEWNDLIQIQEDGFTVARSSETPSDKIFIPFSKQSLSTPPNKTSLRGLRIAIDPGHIGGTWGPLEERSFSLNNGPTVQEGDLTLAVAKRIKDILEAKGAIVYLTRVNSNPVTPLRPKDFEQEAQSRIPQTKERFGDALTQARQKLTTRLFIRSAEIKERARLLNQNFNPDFAIALHINANGWEDPENPTAVTDNNAHILVNGGYMTSEIKNDEMRYMMLHRISKGYHTTEIPLAQAVTQEMIKATALPPYIYQGKNAIRVDTEGYIWGRNLLANRIFDCPVIFLEPWTANSTTVYPWAAQGDYQGFRKIGDTKKKSLPSEYTTFVINGVLQYFEN